MRLKRCKKLIAGQAVVLSLRTCCRFSLIEVFFVTVIEKLWWTLYSDFWWTVWTRNGDWSCCG